MNPVRAAIYTKLAGDGTLTSLLSSTTAIYHQIAPSSAVTPFVVFQRQAGTPQWQYGGEHVQQDVYVIKAVDRGSSASRAEDIAARIDVLLTDANLTVTGRVLLGVWRESDVDYPETDGGETYRHAGAMFRVVTAPT